MDLTRLAQIVKKQRDFEKMCGLDIDTIVEKEINELSENFLFKAIEEIVELRKTFPSELNKWSKSRPKENRVETLGELSDVLLFLLNFCLVKKFSFDEILQSIEAVQAHNVTKLQQKKLSILNEEINKVPSATIKGYGVLDPKVIFVSFAPLGKEEEAFLKKAFNKKREILGYDLLSVYFTHLIKSVDSALDANTARGQVEFWYPILLKEIEILSAHGQPLIYSLGTEMSQVLLQKGDLKYRPLMSPQKYLDDKHTAKEYYESQLSKYPIK